MSKYSFTLEPRIKSFVEWQLEHFKEDAAQIERLKRDKIPSATAGYSLTGGISGGVHRNTEDIVITVDSNQYIRAIEHSTKAIEKVLGKCNQIDISLIDLVYWKRTHTVEGAGIKVGLSKSATYRHINNILGAIAQELGYVNI